VVATDLTTTVQVAAHKPTREEEFSITVFMQNLGYHGELSENYFFQLNEML